MTDIKKGGHCTGVAIIGAGYIARYHARAVAENGDRLVRVVSRTMGSAAGLVAEYSAWYHKRFPSEKIFVPPKEGTDISDITMDKDVDCVIITSPNVFHASQAIAMLEAGLSVLVEKPLTPTLEDALKIEAVARKNACVFMTGHMWRADSEALWVAEKVNAGSIGTPVRTEGYGIHERWGPAGWFVDLRKAGGGALIDMGVHAIDTARFLLGDPLPVDVFARIGTRFGTYEVDDDAHLVIGWDNDTYSVVHSGWWQPHAPGPEAATRIWGTNGFASLFPTYVEGAVSSTEEIPERVTPTSMPQRNEHCDQTVYTAQYKRFTDSRVAANQGFPAYRAPEPGIVVTAVVEAAYRSSRDKRIVPISLEGIP